MSLEPDQQAKAIMGNKHFGMDLELGDIVDGEAAEEEVDLG